MKIQEMVLTIQEYDECKFVVSSGASAKKGVAGQGSTVPDAIRDFATSLEAKMTMRNSCTQV